MIISYIKFEYRLRPHQRQNDIPEYKSGSFGFLDSVRSFEWDEHELNRVVFLNMIML